MALVSSKRVRGKKTTSNFMNLLHERPVGIRGIGYHKRNLYPRHLEKTCKAAVKEGKTLRIQFKKLV